VVEHYDGSQQLEQLIDQAKKKPEFSWGNFQGPNMAQTMLKPWLNHGLPSGKLT